jgi:hypothetical protein
LLLPGNDACDIFLKFVIVFLLDEILPAFHGENYVNLNLSVSVGHA